MYASIASRMLAIAPARVSPWLMQPGKLGHSASQNPSSPGERMTCRRFSAIAGIQTWYFSDGHEALIGVEVDRRRPRQQVGRIQQAGEYVVRREPRILFNDLLM